MGISDTGGGMDMGRTRLIARVVEYQHPWRGWQFLGEYRGRVSEAALSDYRNRYNASLLPGGVNAHVGINAWASNVRIRDQRTGAILATVQAPMFEAIA